MNAARRRNERPRGITGTDRALLTFWRAFIDAWIDELSVALHGCKKFLLSNARGGEREREGRGR